MHNLVTQIQPLIKIRRNRSLPVPGTVLVRPGQKVSPSEVLAESILPTRHIMIDVFKSLGIKNDEHSQKLINRKIGEQLDKHDIIAETGGLFSRVIRAPMPGKIVSKRNGQVLLEVESRKVTVQSGFTGQVVEIVKDRGAIIETNCSLIQGVWGNGKTGFGPFISDAAGIDQELIPSSLGITARGTVMAAAWCESEEALIQAENLPISGLILGSLDHRLIKCALSQNYPIILLEGFGETKINEAAKNLLLRSSQREMSLNAVKWDHFNGLRPEISIALMEEGDSEKETAQSSVGQTVRIHTSPYAGQTGVITAINTGKTTLPNGLRAESVSVMVENNKTLVVPISNFDIIKDDNRSLV